MTTHERVFGHIGSALREAGLLILVFGLLDEYHRASATEPVRLGWVAAVIAISLGSIASGIVVDVLLTSPQEVER